MAWIAHRCSLTRILAVAGVAVVATTAVSAQEEGAPRTGTTVARETAAAPAEQAKAEEDPVVLMKTSMGDIKIRLFRDKAPITVANFMAYVDEKFYDGTIFHRVIRDFMIQGGGFTADFTKKETRPPIKNEADNGLSNKRGTIAMARTNIVDSATSQFFINVVDNLRLDHNTRDFGYAVFGEVTEGMDVVDKIRAVKTGAKGQFAADCPLAPVTIISVRRAEG